MNFISTAGLGCKETPHEPIAHSFNCQHKVQRLHVIHLLHLALSWSPLEKFEECCGGTVTTKAPHPWSLSQLVASLSFSWAISGYAVTLLPKTNTFQWFICLFKNVIFSANCQKPNY